MSSVRPASLQSSYACYFYLNKTEFIIILNPHIAFRNFYLLELCSLSAESHTCFTIYQKITENNFGPLHFISQPITHKSNTEQFFTNQELYTAIYPINNDKDPCVDNVDRILIRLLHRNFQHLILQM